MGAHKPQDKFKARTELPFGSNPVRAQPYPKHEIAKHRELRCARYNVCLTHVRDNDWPGFTCRYCACPDRLTPDDHKRDIDAMASMYRYANKVLAREDAKPPRTRSRGKK